MSNAGLPNAVHAPATDDPVGLDDISLGAKANGTTTFHTQSGAQNVAYKGPQNGTTTHTGSGTKPAVANGSTMSTDSERNRMIFGNIVCGAAQVLLRCCSAQDKYCEAKDFVTWTRDGAVKLRYGNADPMESIPAMTIMSMFKSTVKKFPDQQALAWKSGETWQFLNYRAYYDQVLMCAKSFLKLGLTSFKGVGILGFNCKEWFIANMGAIFAGGLSVGIYSTNSAEACAYVINSSEAQICVVENDAQLKKILEVWDECPSLKAVVQISGKPTCDRKDVFSWDDMMKLGAEVPNEQLQSVMDNQFVNKCCSLIYTSGTTGKPKGVMLSHDNLTFASRTVGKFVRADIAKEVLISYLPLSHIAAQLLDMYIPLCYAATVYFAKPDALRGSLNTTMKEVLPTIFFGVPRVYEKMQEKLKAGLSEATGLKRKLIDWARSVATKTAQNMQLGEGEASGNWLASTLIFKKLRVLLGLSRCKYIYCGAAPLAAETHEFFSSLAMPIMEVYGMSESTGATTMSVWMKDNKHWKSGSAGFRINGYGYDLLNKDEKGHGEVAMKGRNVFMGYLGEEDKTRETFDAEYRLRSGDIGFTDNDDFLFITGRIKELLITAGGENVAPVPIEDIVKEELPVISNCMLVGDRKKFLSLLIALKTEVNTETLQPTDEFTPAVKEWCRSLGSQSTQVPHVLDGKDPLVTKALNAGIERANERSESRAKKIAKFAILPIDFSMVGGELGPTLKLKRPAVVEKYQDVIDTMYADSSD